MTTKEETKTIEVSKALLSVHHAAHTERTRYAAQGIVLEPDGTVVATDQKILATLKNGTSWEGIAHRVLCVKGVRAISGKLTRKNLDFIVVNDVSRADIGFEADDNAVTILSRGGDVWTVPKASKHEIADAILDRVFEPVPVGNLP